MSSLHHQTALYDKVATIISESRHRVHHKVNSELVQTYWSIGKLIVEDEQNGASRAEYGTQVLRSLGVHLSERFGAGFDSSNLRRFRQFFLAFPICDTVCHKLSWSHYRLLIRVKNESARQWYMKEAVACSWSVRALERQIGTNFYERLLASNDKQAVQQEADEKIAEFLSPADIIRDPYILEFLGLPGSGRFLEADFEQALMDHLQSFLLELGRGFAFVSRQERISTETKDFYIDLVFYNFRLKCFVLIDIKRGELTHQDIGQMDMYVRMYDELRKDDSDKPTVGLILCTGADESVVHFSVMEENKQLFASEYSVVLPNEAELRAELEQEKCLREARAEYNPE